MTDSALPTDSATTSPRSDAPEQDFLLVRLLIGLDALSEKREKRDWYPYPSILCKAWNELSLRFLEKGKRPPAALGGLLTLCQRPVGEWFPDALPDDFPAGAGLLYSGSGVLLTSSADEFLNEGIYRTEKIRTLAGAAQIERALQNAQFVTILERLRADAKSNYARAQRDYILLRRFLIANPFTTTAKILDAFAGTSVQTKEVGGLYADCHPDETYRCCPNCGPLMREAPLPPINGGSGGPGRWRGAKPDVCSDHLTDAADAQNILYEFGLRRLCAAIHQRVCLHGIEEVRFLDAVHARRDANPDALTEAEDWPGIDWCDLRVAFADGTVWVVDMKDYRDPEQLTSALKPFDAAPSFLADSRVDRAFYVVPDRRESRSPGYCRRARRGATLPENHVLVTATEFLHELEIQMTRCRAAKGSAKRRKKEKSK